MNYPFLHWDILELLTKRYSSENSLGETCKRLRRLRLTKKSLPAFTASLTSVKWLISSSSLSKHRVSIIVAKQGNIPILKQMKHDGCLIIDDEVLGAKEYCYHYDWGRHNTPTFQWLCRQVIKTGFNDWPGYTTREQDELEDLKDYWEWVYYDEYDMHRIYAEEFKEHEGVVDDWFHDENCLISMFNDYEDEELMQYEDDLLAHQIYHDYHVIVVEREIHVLSVHDN